MNIQPSKSPKGNDPRKGVYFGFKQTTRKGKYLSYPSIEDILKEMSSNRGEIY
jgi:hypothetical protein